MNKSLLASLVLAVSCVLWFVFGMPQYDEWKADRVILEERKQLLADAQASQQNLTRLVKEYSENEATIQRVLIALPNQRQYDYITSSIQTVVADSGLSLSKLNVAEGAKGTGGFQATQISIEMSGQYPQLLNFLDALEKSLRLYDITKISVATLSNGGNDGLVNVTIQMNTYSLK